MKRTIIFLLSCWALIAGAWSQTGSSKEVMKLFEYDRNEPLDIEDRLILLDGEVEIHDVSYAVPNGGRVTAFLVRPAGKGPYAAILFGHWGYGTKTEFLPEAIQYAKVGTVSLLIDFVWVRPEPWR
ncbi:MAG: hypothetical protein IMZ53_08170 [Thermoplasmata archaeon]|nr:hypothetical protein [Thermoplasmata archaeon]